MIDRRLFKLPGLMGRAIVIAVLMFIQAIMIVIQARYLSQAVVNLWHLQPIGTIVTPTAIFIVSFLARHLLGVFQQRTFYPFVEQTSGKMRSDLMTKLFRLGPSVVEKAGTGSVVTMALEGIDKVQTYLMLIIIKMMDMSITPWIILIYIAFLQWNSALFLLVIYPVIILFMVILGLAAQSKADQQFAGYQHLSNNFVDTLRGLPTLKQLGLSKRYADNVYHVSEDYRKETMATLRIAMTSTFALDFFTTLSIAVVAVFLGFDLMDGHIALLPALTILTLAPDYFLSIRNFANDYHATLNGKNALQSVLDVLEMPEIEDRQALTDGQWHDDSHIQFNDVTFTYDNMDTPTLTHLSFDVHGNTKVGIIGASGSGKSTLINLIGGFLSPDEPGKIRVNGQGLPHLGQDAWQADQQYIPQKPYLFHDTLAKNVAFYVPTATRDQIEQACANAGLTDWITTLPDGLDTMIGEGSRGVSGGQAQRIALARAFLDDSRHVLLFDEPTAHLDIETEAALKQDILPLLDNHLVFFATHRLHWINQMDYVLVMDHGVLVEQGTPSELAQRNGAYTKLRAEMGGAK
ncbi:thiol reductant ABC exporter subunit CydD [Secundilactobacillus paracollinoides]|uniref:Thiol reductant ABC exporter subunit CydD n=1 Tax=Secundilactobacillus paracollinoides TaxID=240427 RepID=A0A1B2J1Y3_9LACO|nr:thiol reductant ABC exporter subunit CydD [Secundilactobacillus paracollinoides]ANZ62356.1 thiol reductant ABC exporter subunit CydD [Secundilactobacillus paracollinoides]ANZ68302.1 thiol reductant ABC exporter subunit CydD [Secundilactobacillus paracollinoides]